MTRALEITNELIEVLKDHDCSVEEARNLLADALSDYENAAERDYERQQERLMETGGSDDSSYRRDMIAAGRGHLIGGA